MKPDELPRGIRWDAARQTFLCQVAVGERGDTRRVSKRFPRGTPVKTMALWLASQRVQLEDRRTAPRIAGTVGHAVATYLAAPEVKALAMFKSRRSEVRAWEAALGERTPRAKVTTRRLRQVMDDWATADVSPKTIRNRVIAWQALTALLEGPSRPNPFAEVPLPAVTRATQTFVTADTVVAVATRLGRWPATQARFMVLTASGVRPIELMRTVPETDIDYARALWSVRTAKGGVDRIIPLTPDMRAAWIRLVELKATGAYDTSQHAKRLRWAGWPDSVRPYRARGMWGIDLSASGADLADVQALLGHADIKTTRAYYVPALVGRLAQAVTVVGSRFAWAQLLAPPESE